MDTEAVRHKVSSYESMVQQGLSDLADVYREITGQEPNQDASQNIFLFNSLWFAWRDTFVGDLREMIHKHPEWFKNIGLHAQEREIFRYPAILIFYYWANFAPIMTRNQSPIKPEDLRLIFSDSGFKPEFFDYAAGGYMFYPNGTGLED